VGACGGVWLGSERLRIRVGTALAMVMSETQRYNQTNTNHRQKTLVFSRYCPYNSQNGNYAWALPMHVIALKTLRDFWTKHTDAEQSLRAWYQEACHAAWKSFTDIKARYRSADCLPGNRVVFNIKGNQYRLVVQIHYQGARVFIRFIGTHAEYDKINAETI
jgi:mRNA interferase HigB